MYLKIFQLISATADFLLLLAFSLWEDWKQYVHFWHIRLEPSFYVEVMTDFFFFTINNIAYFSPRNFNTMHIKTFLNHGIRICVFGKSKNTSFNPQLVYSDILKEK